jgi:hypothetical protein
MRRKRKQPEELWVKLQRLEEATLAGVAKQRLSEDEQRRLLRKKPGSI